MAAARTIEHVQALSELFHAELEEYLAVQRRRAVCLLIAGGLLLVCLLLAGALAVMLLLPYVGWTGAVALVLLAFLIVAVLLLLRASALGKASLAPVTCEELQNDWQCLKLLLKGNEKF